MVIILYQLIHHLYIPNKLRNGLPKAKQNVFVIINETQLDYLMDNLIVILLMLIMTRSYANYIPQKNPHLLLNAITDKIINFIYW